ncbi:MAG: hypothetical protein MPI95_07610 [Nitrosopumilus sp.]|nr:hypothetical protein [Nitrosopumilus sp.]CAI9832207.1 hypothetical protein IBTHAUMO2_620010 [Nitrosopumilaceae archaeon]MDA7945527.1 hypothetical protein [Nitrosopumilus sp.]MDA7953832.1 hypothetical protein [Nitrosopumilus sp.]MDA7955455.1 hypothetical protein [Nitrosopumilus sp.]
MGSERHRELLGLFNGIGKRLDTTLPEGRTSTQSITYLASVNGIDLGYEYSWGLFGPYSKGIDRDASRVLEHGADPADPPGDLGGFREFITPHIDDPAWLEVAASVIYLWRVQYEMRPLEDVAGQILTDMTCIYRNFGQYRVGTIIEQMAGRGLLGKRLVYS